MLSAGRGQYHGRGRNTAQFMKVEMPCTRSLQNNSDCEEKKYEKNVYHNYVLKSNVQIKQFDFKSDTPKKTHYLKNNI